MRNRIQFSPAPLLAFQGPLDFITDKLDPLIDAAVQRGADELAGEAQETRERINELQEQLEAERNRAISITNQFQEEMGRSLESDTNKALMIGAVALTGFLLYSMSKRR